MPRHPCYLRRYFAIRDLPMPPRKSKRSPTRRDVAGHDDALAAWFPAVWYLGAALTFWSFGYTTMRGSDLWWHLAGGRWMWEAGTVWVGDPFSYTAAGKDWLNDAWLAGVTLYLWAHWITLESLAYWKWALIILTWLLLFRLAWRLSGDATSSFLACVLSIAVAAPFLDVRPQLYSFLAWVVLLDMCCGRPKPSRAIPLVMLLWANLHAGFFLGLITLPVLLLPHFLDAEGRGKREVVLIGVVAALACLINPNGFEVVTRPLLHAFDTSSPYRTLGEWLPPFQPGGIQSPMFPYGIAAFAAAAAVVAWISWNRPQRVAAAVPLMLGALTLAMALQSRRFVPIFALTEVLVAAPALARMISGLVGGLPAAAPPLGALALGLWWMSAQPLSSSAFDDLTARDSFPIDTCEFIKANDLEGKTFAYYNWGGFVQLCTGGRMKIFIDGRAETVYDEATFLDYLKVLHQRPGWERVVDGSGADFVLWPARSGGVGGDLVASGRWRLLYQDIVSVLLARSDLPLPSEMKPSADSPYRDVNRGMQQLQAGDAAEATRLFERALAADAHMFPACLGLVRSQAAAGQFAAADATADRCAAMTSDTRQGPALHAFVDAVRAKAAKR